MKRCSSVGRRALLAGSVAAALPAITLPGAALAQAPAAPPRVLSTIAMIGDLVREIGGDRVRAETLLGEGVDPHSYKPTRADIARLNAADAILYNGLLLEGQMTDVFVRLARGGKPVFAVTELLAADQLLIEDDGKDDPHVWMDVTLWTKAAEHIRDELARLTPANAEAFRRNHAGLAVRLAALDGYVKQVTGTIPENARVLVTAHDAFGYFARRYGIAVEGIQGLSTEAEAGLRRIQDLVAMLVERRVPAVFVETSVSDRNVRALIEGAAAQGHRVAVGGALFSDAMGPPGSYEGTYIGMMDHNATVIARALGGTAPARGLNGRLAG
ncbi:metal ABC transporter solute-binding protein, Zn/Mn family [Elioraea sp.]|uniref:metal ABC transporter solute-binding protein, Zn/Mn family n=1 Tax=Elioraea sp. TaxID=2185103 RepID=UPI0025B9BCAF|nr:zinc ABC transporter substrate-binding protein [Elioraea sp.]